MKKVTFIYAGIIIEFLGVWNHFNPWIKFAYFLDYMLLINCCLVVIGMALVCVGILITDPKDKKINHLSSCLKLSQKQTNRWKESFTNLTQQNNLLKYSNDELTETVNRLKKEVNQYRLACNAAEYVGQCLEQEISNHKRKISALSGGIGKLKKDFQNAKFKIEKHSDSVNETFDELLRCQVSLSKKLNEKDIDNKKLTNQLNEIAAHCELKDKEIGQLRTSLNAFLKIK